MNIFKKARETGPCGYSGIMKELFSNTDFFERIFRYALYLLVAAVAFRSFNQLNADYDLWFHILLGKELLIKGIFHRFDVYSFTAFGLPVINHEWLSESIIAGFYVLWGDIGLIVWRWLMILLMLFLVIRLIQEKTSDPVIVAICMLFFVIVLRPGVNFRPHLFTYLLLLILLFYLRRFQSSNNLPSSLKLGLFFVVWANLHGGFVLGLLIWFLFLTHKVWSSHFRLNLWRFLSAFFIPAFATLINPYGFGLWKYIFNELSNPLNSIYITEWQRFRFESRELPFLLVTALTWIFYLIARKPKPLFETAILILSTLMGLLSVRNTPLFVLLNLPGLAGSVENIKLRWTESSRSSRAGNLPQSLASFMLITASIPFIGMGLPDRWEIRHDQDPLPAQTVSFLKENQFRGNLWVPLHWGAYSMYHLHPDIKISIDGRWAMVYPRAVMKANMVFAYEGVRGKWKAILEKYHADFALVEAGNPALEEIRLDPDWIIIYQERYAALAAKRAFLELNPEPR